MVWNGSLASMILHGPVRFYTVLYGLVRSFKFLYGLEWSYLNFYGPIRFGVFMYGLVRFCKGLYFIVLFGFLRSCTVMCGPMSSMVFYSHVWLGMAPHGPKWSLFISYGYGWSCTVLYGPI